MYTHFFNLTHSPFSIAPDPRFLFMSESHREALAHLLYGIGGGGFVLLTGEIGAGKTTVCRCFLEQIPDNCNVAYIFNPKLTVNELLKSICDEFDTGQQSITGDPASIKTYVDSLNAFLLGAHAEGKSNVLIIDEAQSLSAEVLEQLRLLTNLETNERKLLQIILIGQPELRALLAKPELKQLAQRIIARYHLGSLSLGDTARYVQHRLAVAGNAASTLLPQALMKPVHRLTQGVPRRINLLCDRALLGAYAEGRQSVNRRILRKAACEVFGSGKRGAWRSINRWIVAALAGGALIGAAAMAIIVHPVIQDNPRVAQRKPSASTLTPVPAVVPAAAVPPAPAPAPAPVPAPVPDVARLPAYPQLDLDTWTASADVASADPAQAYRSLARLWEVTLLPGDPCASAPQSGVRCYRSNKGFAEIRQLDRPAALSLHDQTGHVYYALLTALNDTQATVMIGDQSYSVSLVALERHFHGEFATFWKVPAGYREKIGEGDNGEDVNWVNAQLAKLNGLPIPNASQPFDATAAGWIREFQSTQGLRADGVVGPKTYMQLNRAVDNTEPRLARDTPAATALPGK